MRLYGLVALYHNKSFDKLTDAIAEDVCLTHSHPETVHIAIIYGTMLWQAINGSNANDIYQWGKKYCNHSPLFTALFDAVDNEKNIFSYNGEKYTMSQIDTHIFGFVGFALWLLLRAIKKQTSYANAILEVVSYGGDTDTNACIVGAVMGALYPDTIPAIWINNLLSCSAKNRYKQYPIADPKVWLKWLP
jgi:ADP-ribosylglycohydrolase